MPLSLPSLTKEELQELYITKKQSVLTIARSLGSHPKAISRYLKRFGINARPFSTKGLQTRLGAVLSEETKDKIRIKAIGRVISPEVRMKMGSKGQKNPSWIDGRTPLNKRIRHSVEYRLWKEAVFERDNWTCQFCGTRGGELNADHIKPFAHHPDLRTSISNGRTLCVPCHRKTDTFGHRSSKAK